MARFWHKRYFFLLLIPLVIFLGGALTAHAADYYVSSTGDDANSGLSSTAAWQTIARVNSATFSPGDRIFFEGGKTFSGKLFFDTSDRGSATSPITVASYGAGKATIDGGTGVAIDAYNTAGFRIEHLMVKGAGRTTNTKDGISFYNDLPGNIKLDTIIIDDVEVYGFGDAGISIGAWNGDSGYRNVTISNCASHDNAGGGIGVWGYSNTTDTGYDHENVTVRGCTAYNNSGISGLSKNSGNGIIISTVNGGLIERSTAYNNGWLGAGPVGIWAYDSNNVKIQFNESHHNHTAISTDGGGFDFDGGMTNSVIQYNYSHDNDGPGFLLAQYSGARPFSGNTIRFNISENDVRKNYHGAIQVWNGGSGVKNSEIYNNTVFLSPTSGTPKAIRFSTPSTNVHVRNNIFVATGGVQLAEVASGQTGLLFQGNDYWTSGGAFSILWGGMNYNSFSSWQNATGQEKLNGTNAGFTADPRLQSPGGGGTIGNANNLTSLSAYKLLSTSPLIDAGIDLSSTLGLNPGPQDFFGNPIPQGSRFDIGAHDRAAGTASSPTLSVSSSSVNPGGSVTVTVSGGPGNTTDWVGFYVANQADNTKYLAWKYLSNTQTAPTAGLTSATLTFTMPSTAGTYNFRFFSNNGYMLLATSPNVTVGTVSPPPPPSTTLTPSASSVSPGSSISVAVANAPGSTTDWVAVFPQGGTGSQYSKDWKYLNGLQTAPSSPIFNATLNFTAPSFSGNYEYRLYKKNSVSEADLAAKASFTVAASQPSPPTLTTSSSSVGSGGSVTVTVSNGPGSTTDWVGMYIASEADNTKHLMGQWKYLNGTHTAPATGLKSAVLYFTMPSTAGTYNFRFFSNNGYMLLATSPNVTVGAVSFFPLAPPTTNTSMPRSLLKIVFASTDSLLNLPLSLTSMLLHLREARGEYRH